MLLSTGFQEYFKATDNLEMHQVKEDEERQLNIDEQPEEMSERQKSEDLDIVKKRKKHLFR